MTSPSSNREITLANLNELLELAFVDVNVSSGRVRVLLRRVIETIAKHVDFEKTTLNAVYDWGTHSGEVAEVDEDGNVNLSAGRLLAHADDIGQAIVAQAVARRILGQFKVAAQAGSAEERGADDLARSWGFAVDKFRQVGVVPAP